MILRGSHLLLARKVPRLATAFNTTAVLTVGSCVIFTLLANVLMNCIRR